MGHEADDRALSLSVLRTVSELLENASEVLRYQKTCTLSSVSKPSERTNTYLIGQIVSGVREDADVEEKLLKELFERLGVLVRPPARRHSLDLIDVDDETQTSRILEHPISLERTGLAELRWTSLWNLL